MTPLQFEDPSFSENNISVFGQSLFDKLNKQYTAPIVGHSDITFQFFFENEQVASIESFLGKQPSEYYIEAIEDSSLIVLAKKDFDLLMKEFPEIKSV